MTNAVIAAVMCWTNVAGRVLAATPVSLAGGKVAFSMPSAGGAVATNSYPLSVFPAGEQARIRAALGIARPPADAAEANRRAFAAREEERIAAMERDGLLTADEAAKRRESLHGFMEFRKERQAALPAKPVAKPAGTR